MKSPVFFICMSIFNVVFVSCVQRSNAVSETVNQPSWIQYVANEGVLVSLGETQILIDALHEPYLDQYLPTPDSIWQSIRTASPPFESIELGLITHVHKDHFSLSGVKELLMHQPAECIIPVQAGDSLRISGNKMSADLLSRIHEIDSDFELNQKQLAGVKITSFQLEHSYPPRNAWVQNLAYLIESEEYRLLHLGDANLMSSNLGRIVEVVGDSVDVAMVPFWFLYGKGVKWMEETFHPRHIVAIHVPLPDAATLEAEMEAEDQRVQVFNKPGERLILN